MFKSISRNRVMHKKQKKSKKNRVKQKKFLRFVGQNKKWKGEVFWYKMELYIIHKNWWKPDLEGASNTFATKYVVLCAIWYHWYNSKNVKNTHGGVLLNFTESNTPPWVFFTFFKLYTWYYIVQSTTYS